jgi:hypothetical protein
MRCHVDLVNGNSDSRLGPESIFSWLQRRDEFVDALTIRRIRECQINPLGSKSTSTCCTDPKVHLAMSKLFRTVGLTPRKLQ